MPRIVLQKFGDVPGEEVTSVLQCVEECYNYLKPHDVEIVDLLVFDTSRRMHTHLMEKRGRLGILSEDLGEQFYAMHEAWTGIPRIWVCLERIMELGRTVGYGSLRHEVAHSVLHGSLEYYALPMPPSLLEFSRRKHLSREYSVKIFYLLSVAVKDYEATLLLARRGYIEDQTAYARKVLTASAEDLTSWRISENHPEAMALCLVSRLKDLAPTMALERLIPSQQDTWKTIVNELSYLPPNIQSKMLRTMDRFPTEMRGDTFQNLNAAAQVIRGELLEPLFSADQNLH
jgi:hypothetical protein